MKYRKGALHSDAPDHQLQSIENLGKNEISERTRKTLVMDDESYCTFSGCKMPSNAGFFFHQMSNKRLVQPKSTLLRNLTQK